MSKFLIAWASATLLVTILETLLDAIGSIAFQEMLMSVDGVQRHLSDTERLASMLGAAKGVAAGLALNNGVLLLLAFGAATFLARRYPSAHSLIFIAAGCAAVSAPHVILSPSASDLIYVAFGGLAGMVSGLIMRTAPTTPASS